MKTETNLTAIAARLDFVAHLAEDRGVIDAEDGIPACGGAVYPSSHPRWVEFLDLLIARNFAPKGTDSPTVLRAELLAA